MTYVKEASNKATPNRWRSKAKFFPEANFFTYFLFLFFPEASWELSWALLGSPGGPKVLAVEDPPI